MGYWGRQVKKNQEVRGLLGPSSLQCCNCAFIIFPTVCFMCELQLSNSKLILFNKENINRKRTLLLQKLPCILKFILHVLFWPDLIFTQIHGYISFEMHVSFAARN